MELFYLQLTILALNFCLQLGFFAYSFSFFCHLQLELFCLQWESVSNKGLKGQRSLTVSKKAPTVSKKASSPNLFAILGPEAPETPVTSLLELLSFRLIPVVVLQEEQSLKMTGNNN